MRVHLLLSELYERRRRYQNAMDRFKQSEAKSPKLHNDKYVKIRKHVGKNDMDFWPLICRLRLGSLKSTFGRSKETTGEE